MPVQQRTSSISNQQTAQVSPPSSKHYAQTISRLNNGALYLKQQPYYQQQYLPPASYEPATMYGHQADRSVPPLPLMQPFQASAMPPKQAIQYHTPSSIYRQPLQPSHQRDSLMLVGPDGRQSLLNKPLCRCRVMYLGSSVPHITKNGLHGIQEPLKHLYPEEQFAAGRASGRSADSSTIDISHLGSSLGIDSWLSVWSNGLLLENVDEFGREITRFFSIETLHYCAAVRFFDTKNLMSSEQQAVQSGGQRTNGSSTFGAGKAPTSESVAIDQNNNNTDSCEAPVKPAKSLVRFLPLDAPLFQWPGMVDASHPPVFAAILRRTTGVKVLECHAFICRRDAASNALVRCCTQAYADFLSAKRLSLELGTRQLTAPGYGDPRDRSGQRRRSSSRRRGSHGSGGSSRTVKQISCAYEPPMGAPGSQTGASHSANSTNGTQSINDDQSRSESPINGDHYAIIAKNHAPGNEHDRAAKEREKPRKSKVQGSSKSLFSNFQPAALVDIPKDKSDQSNVGKLSHSLDLLDVRGRRRAVTCCDDEILDFVADEPNKRHSRSMQNLEGAADGPSTRHRSNYDRRPSASSGCSETSGASGQRRHRRKRAASLHELAQSTYVPGEEIVPFLEIADRLANGTGPNPQADDTIYASCQQTELPIATNQHSSGFPAAEADPSPSQTNKSRRKRDVVSAGNRSSSSSQRRHRRHQQSQPQLQPLELNPPLSLMSPAMMMSPNTGYYATNLHPHYALYSPLPLRHPPLPSQAGPSSPLYLPNVYLPPTTYNPNHAASTYHRKSHNSSRPVYSTPYDQVFAPATMGRPLQAKSSAAALPRFRCLSPPMKLLGSTPVSSAKGKRTKEAPAEITTDDRSSVSPAQVVSGRPVFLAEQQPASGRSSKMSWLKRLSLTISPATQLADSEPSFASPDGTPDAGCDLEPQKPQQAHKKRASLFSGSLTIGRRARPKQRQQHEPTR